MSDITDLLVPKTKEQICKDISKFTSIPYNEKDTKYLFNLYRLVSFLNFDNINDKCINYFYKLIKSEETVSDPNFNFYVSTYKCDIVEKEIKTKYKLKSYKNIYKKILKIIVDNSEQIKSTYNYSFYAGIMSVTNRIALASRSSTGLFIIGSKTFFESNNNINFNNFNIIEEDLGNKIIIGRKCDNNELGLQLAISNNKYEINIDEEIKNLYICINYE